MKPFNTLLFTLTFTLLFSACNSKKAQTKKYFRLTTTPISVNTNLRPYTLVVKRPKALSILGSRPIVATQADDSLIQLSYNFWLESPKVLLQDRIKQWAENHWQAVSFLTPAVGTYRTLETRILAFEKKQNQAIATFEFFLYDANNQLVFNQQFTAIENISEDSYKAFAKAISLATESILLQFNSELGLN